MSGKVTIAYFSIVILTKSNAYFSIAYANFSMLKVSKSIVYAKL